MVSDLTLTYLEKRNYAVPTVSDRVDALPLDTVATRYYIAMDKSGCKLLPEGYQLLETTNDEVAYLTDTTTLNEVKRQTEGAKMLTILPILE
jgi:hypothetical protein